MLRITVVPSADGARLLHLSGRIGAMEEAILADQLWEGATRAQILDLTDVQFVDEAGMDLLDRWVRRGLQLRGGSVFLRRLLAERGLSSA